MNLSRLAAGYADLSGYVDVEDGLNRLRKNKTLYARLLNSFARDTHCDELGDQLAKGDLAEAQKTAHMIKGVAANLSLPMVYELSARIDAGLKAGDAGVPFEAFRQAMDKTVAYIAVVIGNLDDID